MVNADHVESGHRTEAFDVHGSTDKHSSWLATQLIIIQCKYFNQLKILKTFHLHISLDSIHRK